MVTGGAGFFGDLLTRRLLADGHRVVSVDLERDESTHPALTTVRGDITDAGLLHRLAEQHSFDAVMHVAAMLAHDIKDQRLLWRSNVDGTRTVAEVARTHGIGKVVFTSSNCLWGHTFRRPVTEDDVPAPVELYGRSKLAGERILLEEYAGAFDTVVFRCPTIVEAGRLGLLAILFEFIEENRKVWVVGGGRNRYQFIAAPDLADACVLALDHVGSRVFNVGSDDVPTFREAYESVIGETGSTSRVATLPRSLALPAMRLAHALRLSPLGPYQYKMIAEDFVFDTSRIKHELGWKPTLTNAEMLLRAYRYYADHAAEIRARTDGSAHHRAADMGVIRVLKWLS
ncbi:NAD-dependent epimerase/dehydratase family protein [Nakamurella leprariae]|uniref:NAD-dependent epimerase/dehydratase family protein n=1 Tax=Nakamurella leprariae TaxID=2803911 RepID=UPI0022A783F0|nr:NAD(P)-dependent oxidoreductase [Nakamurella leprariae]